jgi:hypothetical protein
MAVSAPITTVPRPKPNPRTTLTAAMTNSGPPDSSARDGIPISAAPAASSVRYRYRFIRLAEASSAATVPASSAPVTNPAPALPAPALAAYRGVTESSR